MRSAAFALLHTHHASVSESTSDFVSKELIAWRASKSQSVHNWTDYLYIRMPISGSRREEKKMSPHCGNQSWRALCFSNVIRSHTMLSLLH